VSTRFPIITDQSRQPREVRDTWPRSVPWSFVEPACKQAHRNHDQSLEELARRGGLAPSELWAVVHGFGWFEAKRSGTLPDERECGEWLIAEMKRIGDIK